MSWTGPSTWHDDFLSRELQESSTEESIKAELLADLAKAEEIKSKFGNSEEVKKEYDDVRIATIWALKNLRIQTADHLDEVRRSLTWDINFDTLWDEADVNSSEKAVIDREIRELESLSSLELSEVERIKNTDISELSPDEIKQLLELSQKEFSNYEEQSSVWKAASSAMNMFEWTNSYTNVWARTEMNSFQGQLLNKIYWEGFYETWYNHEYIVWYNNDNWNHISTIPDFESKLDSWEAINPKMLTNYLKYLIQEKWVAYEDLAYTLRNRNLEAINSLLSSSNDLSIKEFRIELDKNGVFQNGWMVDTVVKTFNDWNNKISSWKFTFTELSNSINTVKSRRWDVVDFSKIYTPERIRAIAEMSLDKDITSIFTGEIESNDIVKQVIEERTKIIKERFIHSLQEIYWEVPNVMNYLESIINTKVWTKTFNAENIFWNLSYINYQIERYNINSGNTNDVPLIDGTWKMELAQSITNLHTTLTSNGSIEKIVKDIGSLRNDIQDAYNTLRWINIDIIQEKKQWNEEIVRKLEQKKERILNEILKFEKKRDSYKTEIAEIDQKIESSHTIMKWYELKNKFEWNPNNVNYVLQDLGNRIWRINNQTHLIRFLREYKEEIEKEQVSYDKLNIALQKDVQVIRAYGIENLNPWEGDYSRIWRDIFLANAELSYDIFKWDNGEYLVNLLWNSESWKIFCRELLIQLRKENPEAEIFNNLPYYIIHYDREQNDGKNFSIGISLKNSTWLEYEEITALRIEWKMEEMLEDIEWWMQEYIEEKSKVIDIYFMENPDSNLTIKWETITRKGFYLECIKLWYFASLESVRFNPNVDIDIVKKALDINIANIYFIDPNLLWKEEVRNHILDIIDVENLDLLSNIQILKDNGKPDAIWYLRFSLQIYKKFWSKLENIDSSAYIDEVHAMISFVSDEDYERYIVRDSELNAFYEGMIGMIWLENYAKDTATIVNETKESRESNESIYFEETKSFLAESGIEDTDIKTLVGYFNQWYVISYDISKIFRASKYRELNLDDTFFETLKEKIQEDAKKKIEKAWSISIRKRPKSSVSKLFSWNLEDGYFLLEKELWEDFTKFREENKEDYENYDLVLRGYLKHISISSEDEEYTRIIDYLNWQKTYADAWIVTPDNFLNPPKNFWEDFGLSSYTWELYWGEWDTNTNKQNTPNTTKEPSYNSVQNDRISTSIDGSILLNTNNGNKIKISREELQIIQNNPEAEKNLIQVKKAFDRSWLGKLWNLRQSIFQSIANIKWLSFQMHDDYINKNELKILFDSILISVDEKPLQNSAYTVEEIVVEMERRNGTTLSGEEAEINSYGETKIEAKFLNRYFPKWNLIFQNSDFEQALKKAH